MIFIAKNEDGDPSWKLVQEGRKTVTRRLKPLPVGKEFAVQPGRGKFAICRARVISCMSSMGHYERNADGTFLKEYREHEAHLEGFSSWDGIMKFFQKKGIQFKDTFRIEFEVISRGLQWEKGVTL